MTEEVAGEGTLQHCGKYILWRFLQSFLKRIYLWPFTWVTVH